MSAEPVARMPIHEVPFRELLGIELEHAGGGTARVAIASVGRRHLQSAGVVHGGVYATLIDSVLGSAVKSLLSPGDTLVTAELNVNLLRAVATGRLVADGTVIHEGGTLVIGTAEVRDDDRNLVAVGRATLRVGRNRSRRPGDAR